MPANHTAAPGGSALVREPGLPGLSPGTLSTLITVAEKSRDPRAARH